MNRARHILIDNSPAPQPARQERASWYTPGLSDGLGDRLLMYDNTTASALELLRFRREFGENRAFSNAVRQRIDQLTAFNSPSVAKVRAVDWLGSGEGFALISNQTPGRRLSEVLRSGRGPGFAMELIRQLTPVLATLHRHAGGVVHGALTPERIVVTPEGRLVLLEHVLGSALEVLQLPAHRLRSELGIPVPPGGHIVPLDRRTDVAQLAFVALSLLLGRRIDPTEYPEKGVGLLDEFIWVGPRGSSAPRGLRSWLERALQLGDSPFESAEDAYQALTESLPPHHDASSSQPHPMSFHGFHRLAEKPARTAKNMNTSMLDFPEEQAHATPLESAGSGNQTRLVEFPRQLPAGDGLPADTQEREAAATEPRLTGRAMRTVRWAAVVLAVLVVAEAGVIVGLMRRSSAVQPARPAPAAPAAGTPQTEAPKADAVVDPKSVVPATDVAAKAAAPAGAAAIAAGQGRLEISSDPVGARVIVDGAVRGVTPVTLSLAAGPHALLIMDGATPTSRNITVTAGTTTTFMAAFAAAPAGPGAGWVSIKVPVDLQVREGTAFLGTTAADRIMLPAGHHELALSSAVIGFQTVLPIDVIAGKTANVTVPVPNGSLYLNALPWANVTIDGRALAGSTPFANLEVPLGPHVIIWRHPQLGERQQTVIVTAKGPVRLVMDFSK